MLKLGNTATFYYLLGLSNVCCWFVIGWLRHDLARLKEKLRR